MSRPYLFASLALLGLAGLPGMAHGQTHKLPYVQAGAALGYARAEARILHAAMTARQFDLGFTQATLKQIDDALAEAKRNIDRAETLLPERMAKMSEAVLVVREKIVAAETQQEALVAAVERETRVLTLEDEEEAEDLPPTDWKRLDNETRWLAGDIGAAASAHARLMRPLRVRAPKAVPKARGRRR